VRSAVVVAYALGRVVPGLIVFGSVPIWLRQFGAAEYGVFSVSLAVILASTSIFTGWLRQAAVRFAGMPGRGFLDHPASVLVGSVAAAAVVSMLLSVAALGGDATPPSVWVAIGLNGATLGAYLLAQTALQRDGQVMRYNVAEVARAALGLGASVALGAGGLAGAPSMLFGAVVGNVVAIAVTVSPSRTRAGQPAWQVAQKSWSFGWPLSVWLGVSTLTLYVDRIILSQHTDPVEVGRYTATADVVVRGYAMVALPFVLALHPAFMRAHNAGEVLKARAMLRRWSLALAILLAGSLVLVAALGPVVMRHFLGAQPPGRSTILLLATAAALWQFALLAHKPLESGLRTRTMMVLAIAALAAEVAVSLVLAPSLRARGVATGLLTGSVVYLALVAAVNARATSDAANA
jgi:O-antigen/teichoic acid export membrane protein